MPDTLTFTEKIPFEWIPTASYTKAHEWLNLHNPRTRKMVHAVSPNNFIVLTSLGKDLHGKLTNKLIKW